VARCRILRCSTNSFVATRAMIPKEPDHDFVLLAMPLHIAAENNAVLGRTSPPVPFKGVVS
jgi:hypothetical protein